MYYHFLQTYCMSIYWNLIYSKSDCENTCNFSWKILVHFPQFCNHRAQRFCNYNFCRNIFFTFTLQLLLLIYLDLFMVSFWTFCIIKLVSVVSVLCVYLNCHFSCIIFYAYEDRVKTASIVFTLQVYRHMILHYMKSVCKLKYIPFVKHMVYYLGESGKRFSIPDTSKVFFSVLISILKHTGEYVLVVCMCSN